MIEQENKSEVLGCVCIECGKVQFSQERDLLSVAGFQLYQLVAHNTSISKLHLKHGALLFWYLVLLKVGARVDKRGERVKRTS